MDKSRRLRERFGEGSLDGFAGSEVVEFLLSFVMPGKRASQLASTLTSGLGGLKGVIEASSEELKRAGLDDDSAAFIGLVRTAAGEYLREKVDVSEAIRSPGDVVEYLRRNNGGGSAEKFIGVYLNARNEVISVETLHEGNLSGAAIPSRTAIEPAFRCNARSVIFVHEKPLGPTPMAADLRVSRGLERAASAVDILVHDHIIIGRSTYFSAKENGWSLYPQPGLQKAAEKNRDF